MASKKIFVIIPDGIGLRNFAFSSFISLSSRYGWDVIFWNRTPFSLSGLELNEIPLEGKIRPITNILKRAKIQAELNHFQKKFNDPVYDTYKFPIRTRNIKLRFKAAVVNVLSNIFSGKKGIQFLRYCMKLSERNSDYYKNSRLTLVKEKPDLVFCTSQRPVTAIAPLLAAEDIGIPTCTFIFSWDNLSKATLILQSDYYFVWSNFMKEELKKYYPTINSTQIIETGSPQFEFHSDKTLIEEREDFFQKYNLEIDRKYICYSGDDITTSPDDPEYLNDLANACKELNNEGFNFGVIFRRCPVDFSERYDEIIKAHHDIITPVAPNWSRIGAEWGGVLPDQADQALLLNTIYHCEAVVNLGSTMVFDAALLNKPCFYINYNAKNRNELNWDVYKIYQFVHFRTMPSEDPVIWINDPQEIAEKIGQLSESENVIKNANNWFKIINMLPANEASDRIWKGIDKIHRECT